MRPLQLVTATAKNGLRYIPGFDEWRRMRVDPRVEVTGMDRLDGQWAHLSAFLTQDQIEGETFLEIGPGETIGLALILWLKGAGGYIGVEASRRPLCDARNRDWHVEVVRQAISGRWGPTHLAAPDLQALKDLLRSGLTPDDIRLCSGVAERLPLGSDAVDFSFSFSLFEHVRGVSAALADLARVTREGGSGVHSIDLTSHHRESVGPLDLLEVGDTAWALVSSRRSGGYPNRLRAFEYVDIARAAGWAQAEFRSDQELDLESTIALQATFARRFRAMPPALLQPLQVTLVLSESEKSRPLI